MGKPKAYAEEDRKSKLLPLSHKHTTQDVYDVIDKYRPAELKMHIIHKRKKESWNMSGGGLEEEKPGRRGYSVQAILFLVIKFP